MESFMEVGQGPNWGYSSKERNEEEKVDTENLRSYKYFASGAILIDIQQKPTNMPWLDFPLNRFYIVNIY
jgi:hypothetical protein